MNPSRDSLSLHLPILRGLLAAEKFKNKVIEPLSGQRVIVEEHINTIINLIDLIESLAEKSIKEIKETRLFQIIIKKEQRTLHVLIILK